MGPAAITVRMRTTILLRQMSDNHGQLFRKKGFAKKNPHRVVIYLVDGAIHPWNNFGWNYYMINWNPFSPLQKSTKCSLSTPVGGLESLDSQRLSLTVFWCDSCPARKILVGTEKIKPHTFCNWVKIGSRTGQIYACTFSYWMHVGLFGTECAQQSWKWFALACT